MQRRNFIKKTMIGTGIAISPNVLLAYSKNALPNVLLIGDSVSIGYTNYVKGFMDGVANVQRPLNSGGGYLNCEGTTKGVQYIDEWLGDTKWDVIHFNFGLHDLKHVDPVTGKNSNKQEDPQQADLETYEKNLTGIVAKLKATGAKLIFATTTSYPDKPGGPLRRADQPEKYNKVALKIMKKNDIMVNDLNALTLPDLEKLQPPKNVHFTEAGSEFLAREVVKKIKSVI
ncbi:SGNH/GDSL hydrolase family protein [Reichenbachiella sp. MALMAid0571]|uniref:SGNH/GDSL hydrolase family protein n=1 Tax=Reichenbachiella sp. MALMAid0571 TaxID=3143939 RepID=UPI0032DF64FA